jgi:glycine betaine/proline transport system substrate-binding protein
MKRNVLFVFIVLVLTGAAFAAGETEESVDIVMADASWDSIIVHNRIVAFILENGYGGYSVDYIPAATPTTVQSLRTGDIHIMMESWHENYQEVYDEIIAEGSVVNVGANMPQAPQGWYVPRYMIEGDSARGIDASAPDLRSVEDLPRYASLFQDPEDPDKGRILVGPPGWSSTEISQGLLDTYDLHDTYNGVLPGSDAALAASMVGAYERGEPWIGYYWEPTAVLGKLDMVMVPGSEFPRTSVDVLVNAEFAEANPEVVALLEAYETTLAENNAILAAMDDDDLDAEEAAVRFLEEYEETWTQWVDDDVAERVKAAL